MKKIQALICLMIIGFSVSAQQDLFLSQQFFSRINKNPAGVGNSTDLDFFLMGRYQYMEIKDAPKSGVFNVQTFFDNLHSGFGLSVSYDKLGIARNATNAKLAYAYTLSLNDDLILSLGLSAGVQHIYFDPNKYTWEDAEELGITGIPEEAMTKTSPDFDFGFELTTPRLLIGASITHLTVSESTTMQAARHYYGYMRYMFPVGEAWQLAPAASFMHKSKVDVVDFSFSAFYERFLWGAINYHPDIHDKFQTNPMGFTIGIEYRNFRLGYTFDWAFGKVSKFSGNAQELMLSYSIATQKKSSEEERFY